jgi:spermidine synthase
VAEASKKMSASTRRLLFCFFFISGFSGLVYQVVWTRMAFASFGIISPVLSVVISMFMLGLSVGAWAGGRWIQVLTKNTGCSAIGFYALAELLIGLGAFAVPKLFSLGEQLLLKTGAMDSVVYLSLSGAVLAMSILPWCFFMGATFPLMMAYIREDDEGRGDSFSFLYVANVLGAMAGVLLTAIALIEIFGFRHTLWIAAAGNFSIAAICGFLAWKQGNIAHRVSSGLPPESAPSANSSSSFEQGRLIKPILFATGFVALAMELIWTRAFTPILKTQVYSFAMILFAYLGATFVGSLLYRRALRKNSVRSIAALVSMLSVTAFLPIVLNDLWLFTASQKLSPYISALILLSSICPLCGALGYLTPSLIDEVGRGDPAKAGKAYSLNVIGCILGPLFASYILLPWLGERYSLILLALPFLGFFASTGKALPAWHRLLVISLFVPALIWSLFFSVDFARFVSILHAKTEVRRDYAASVVSSGEGFNKELFVNGIGMTVLTPITKFMVHLPLAYHHGKADSALIICFGMGTTYRSALSWNLETTAVELVPSVKEAFGFYHADAARVLDNPRGRIVIDDGRRFLKRTRDKFDVIVIDPPPPVEAAGSSLLYSEEFYELAKRRLRPNGILQAWYPGGSDVVEQAIARSLQNSFPHVRYFQSIGGRGLHMLASMEPLGGDTPEEIAAFTPLAAAEDLVEWSPAHDSSDYFAKVQAQEVTLDGTLNPDPEIRVTDDRPFNEYFLLRRWGLTKPGAR